MLTPLTQISLPRPQMRWRRNNRCKMAPTPAQDALNTLEFETFAQMAFAKWHWLNQFAGEDPMNNDGQISGLRLRSSSAYTVLYK
jgi:hypothetical protein